MTRTHDDNAVDTRRGRSTAGLPNLPTWNSLGGGCQVAYHLRRWSLRTAKTPFDWIRTPFSSVANLIESNFREFLVERNLQWVPGPYERLVDTRNRIVLPHNVGQFKLGGFAAIESHFRPQVQAFLGCLTGDCHSIFVRRNAKFEDSDRVLRLLGERRPRHSFTLITVDEGACLTPRFTRRSESWIQFDIPTPQTGHWVGCLEVWDWVFEKSLALLAHVFGESTMGKARSIMKVGVTALGADWIRVLYNLHRLFSTKDNVMSQLPDTLLAALVAGEDHRFYAHRGIDSIALMRAAKGVLFRRPLGGGSTIEQQLFRVLSERRERSVRRKVRELLGARLLASIVEDKEQLARAYLVVAYFGTNMAGIEQACDRLHLRFDSLQARQSAELVARLKYPESKNPTPQKQEMIEARARYIEKRVSRTKR